MENLKRLKQIAEKRGYILNSNEKQMENTVRAMSENFKKFGKYYCPCKQSRPLNIKNDSVCPCEELHEEISDLGHCFCRVFYKKANG